MKTIPFHTAYLHQEEVLAIHDALVFAGHEELAGLLGSKATRTEVEKQYAAAIQLGDENVFSMDDSPIVSASEEGAYVMVWQWMDQSAVFQETTATG